jgi:hypothetical protein
MVETKLIARPWTPQDLLDDLQDIINEEPDNYLNTRRTTLEMALAYLKEHFYGWIPVSERLPEKGQNVIALGSRGGVYVAQYQGSRYWHKLNARCHMCEPTHWMPLPEAPKEDN